MTGERGVSSVVSTVLLIAVVLIVAVTAGNYALQFAGATQDPSPQFHASMEPIAASDGMLVVSKNGGDEVDMDELEILIRNQNDGTRVRLVNLSATTFDSSNLEGDGSMVNGSSASGELVVSGGDGTVSADDSIAIELLNADSGDRITVQIVHVPTDSIIWTDSTRVTG